MWTTSLQRFQLLLISWQLKVIITVRPFHMQCVHKFPALFSTHSVECARVYGSAHDSIFINNCSAIYDSHLFCVFILFLFLWAFAFISRFVHICCNVRCNVASICFHRRFHEPAGRFTFESLMNWFRWLLLLWSSIGQRFLHTNMSAWRANNVIGHETHEIITWTELKSNGHYEKRYWVRRAG